MWIIIRIQFYEVNNYEYRLYQSAAVTELRQKLLVQRKYSFYLKNVHFHHPPCIQAMLFSSSGFNLANNYIINPGSI